MYRSAFGSDPMNPSEGLRYRYTVLEKGGSRDGLKLITEFLGREPNPEAFYRELGILKEEN